MAMVDCPPAPVAGLPQSILLYHLAQLHLHHAHRVFLPRLFQSPSAPRSEQLIGSLDPGDLLHRSICSYRHHLSIAIAALQSILSLPSTDALHPPLELLVRAQLVRILIHQTEHYHPRAYRLLLPAFELARRSPHHSLPLSLHLSESLIILQSHDPTVSFRQIKKSIQRAIELTKPSSLHPAPSAILVDPKSVSYYYRFQLLLVQLAYHRAHDHPTALAALRAILTLAESRRDDELWIATKAYEIKLALDSSQSKLVGDLFHSILPRIQLPLELQPKPTTTPQDEPSKTPTQPTIVVGQQLINHILLLYVIHTSIIGDSQTAKLWLRHLRTRMDSLDPEDGELEGIYKIYLNPHSPPIPLPPTAPGSPFKHHSSPSISHQQRPFQESSQPKHSNLTTLPHHSALDSTIPSYVKISIMPRELIYTLTYVVSLAVHLDGHGKSPKSMVYALEGLKRLDRQLSLGFQFLTNYDHGDQIHHPSDGSWSPSILTSIGSYLKLLLAMKIETKLMMSQIAIVRSDFDHADQLLVETIKMACQQSRWDSYSPRIAFLKAMLSHATGNLPSARQSLLSVMLTTQPTRRAPSAEPAGAATHHSTPDRIELGHLAQACYVLVRLSEDDRPHPDHHHHHDPSRSFAVENLIKELTHVSHHALPNLNMVIQVVLAMSCGEIVKSKQHLTLALNEANKTSNTHLKMILLGLLSTTFLNTRSDQATQMLKSCFKLSLGFSSITATPTALTPLQPRSHQAQLVGPSHAPSSLALPPQSQPSIDPPAAPTTSPITPRNVAVGNPSLGLWVGKKLVELYRASRTSIGPDDEDPTKLEAKLERLMISNRAHQDVLDRTRLL